MLRNIYEMSVDDNNYDLQNVECQLQNLMKTTKVPKASSYELW